MTNTYVSLYSNSYDPANPATNRIFQFNPAPLNIDLNYDKTGVNNIDIPGQVRPIGFDMTSQSRQIRLEFILMTITPTYTTPGTGSYLDQMQDLDKAAQSLTNMVPAGNYYILVVPFTEVYYASHATTWNSENPGTVIQSSGDKLFYVNFRSLHFRWEGGTPSYLKGEVVFEEIDQTGAGVISI